MYYSAKQFWKIVVCVFLAGGILAGCAGMFATPIEKILKNPRDYSGKTVTVSGKVTEATGLIFMQYFVVKDKTGEITVITKRPLPRENTKITVKGQVDAAFSLGDKQLIVIVENDKK